MMIQMAAPILQARLHRTITLHNASVLFGAACDGAKQCGTRISRDTAGGKV